MSKQNERKLLLENFVKTKHKNQVRKGTGLPCYNHLLAVAKAAEKTNVLLGYEIGLCHDLLEDTNCSEGEFKEVLDYFGYKKAEIKHIVNCVIELTDIYTHDAYPLLNRAKRKELETKRLERVSKDAQTIKYLDLIDNTISIVQNEKWFAEKYLAEKEAILFVMIAGDKEVYNKCVEVLNQVKSILATI